MKRHRCGSPRTRLYCAFIPVLMGLWYPFIHLYLLNGSNLTVPLGMQLPLVLGVGLVAAAAGFLLQSVGPTAWRRAFSLFLLGVGTFAWAEGTLLLGDFGFLHGGNMDWDGNRWLLYGEAALLILLILMLTRFRRWTLERTGWITLALCISAMASIYPAFDKDRQRTDSGVRHTFTPEGTMSFSAEGNVLVFIVDTFQSDVFAEILADESQWKDEFEGFTYFPDTISGFPKTYASIPNLLTGVAFDNCRPFPIYQKEAFLGDSLPRVLKDEGYDVRYRAFTWQPYFPHPAVADNLSNLESTGGRQWMQRAELTKLANLVLFRLAPYHLKPWVYNDNQFRLAWAPVAGADDATEEAVPDDARVYSAGNNHPDLVLHDEFLAMATADSPQPALRVFHFQGVHEPLVLDEDLNLIPQQTESRESFLRQARGMLKLVDEELDKLRAIGAYDNSLIFILGDHGAGEYGPVGFKPELGEALGFTLSPRSSGLPGGEHLLRGACPLLMVKRRDSRGPMQVSRAPAELGDIPATVFAELDLDGVDRGPSLFELHENDERVRLHKYYRFSGWGRDFIVPMTESRVTGFAWDANSWAPSSRDLNRQATEASSGALVIFGQGGNLSDFKHEGWSGAEFQGRRLVGDAATVSLPLREGMPDQVLTVLTRPFMDEGEPYWISLHAADRLLGVWRHPQEQPTLHSVLVPAAMLAGRNVLEVRMQRDRVQGHGPLIIEMQLESASGFPALPRSHRIETNAANPCGEYLQDGWAPPESWGTWSLGTEAQLRWSMGEHVGGPYHAFVRLRPALFPGSPPVNVDVLMAGEVVANLELGRSEDTTLEFPLPATNLEGQGNVEVFFSIGNPRSPRDYGRSGDPRPLGIGLLEFGIIEDAAVDHDAAEIRPLLPWCSHSANWSGLYGAETWRQGKVAWTDGRARVQDAVPLEGVRHVEVQVEHMISPDGVMVVLDHGTPVGSARPAHFPWIGRFPLNPGLADTDLEILSSRSRPTDVDTVSGDRRSLGVALSCCAIVSGAAGISATSFLDLAPWATDAWHGVHAVEAWQGQSTCWTDREARVRTHWPHAESPRFMVMETAGSAPGGASLTVEVNGHVIWDDIAIEEEWIGLADVSALPWDGEVVVRIETDTFCPASEFAGARDERNLGVAIRKLMLTD